MWILEGVEERWGEDPVVRIEGRSEKEAPRDGGRRSSLRGSFLGERRLREGEGQGRGGWAERQREKWAVGSKWGLQAVWPEPSNFALTSQLGAGIS